MAGVFIDRPQVGRPVHPPGAGQVVVAATFLVVALLPAVVGLTAGLGAGADPILVRGGVVLASLLPPAVAVLTLWRRNPQETLQWTLLVAALRTGACSGLLLMVLAGVALASR